MNANYFWLMKVIGFVTFIFLKKRTATTYSQSKFTFICKYFTIFILSYFCEKANDHSTDNVYSSSPFVFYITCTCRHFHNGFKIGTTLSHHF